MSLKIMKLGLLAVVFFLVGSAARALMMEEIALAGDMSLDPGASPDVTNIIAAHNRNSPQYKRDCTSCHSQVLSEQSLNPAIHTAHVKMRSFVPGEDNDDKCAFCHRTVDLLESSGGNIRKQVDTALCAVCHGTPRPATKVFYKTGPSLTQPNGAELYALVCSGCHGALARSEVRGESASEIQEKINKNEGGMRPLGILTTLEIQAIARALAQ